MKKEKMFLIIALVMVVAMAVPAVSATTMTIGSKTFAAAGETGTIEVTMDSVPNGISGFMFNVTIDDPAVAEFSSITGPAWADVFKSVGLADWQVVKPDDSFIKVLAPTAYPPGSTNVLLATISITAKGPGTATAIVVPSGVNYEMSDNSGALIVPTVVPGILQVGPICADADQDGICDVDDNCPAVANADQADTDGDGAGDACEECDTDANKTEGGMCGCGVADTDSDGDGVADCNDLCPADPAKIAPGDCGCGNVEIPGCGVCSDADTDGVCDADDNCPAVANADQANADQDGAGDACEECDTDANKTEGGICGCGVADTDSDGDGVADCNDLCPADPAKTAPGTCGCGVVDTPFCGGCSDVDSDGVCDTADNCPAVANADQADADQDGAGDACDRCPSDPAKTVPGQCGCGVAEGTCPAVPEFPSMVVPAISVIGVLSLVFLAQKRKEN